MTSSAIGQYVIGQSPIQGASPPPEYSAIRKTILSYLYQQYNDDDDLQAFVESYNAYTQAFLDWFNDLNLPIYTKLSGGLLDWVALGLYGMARPSLGSTRYIAVGAFNSYAFNTLALNQFKRTANSNYAQTNDDFFKRCLTWNFYKGDGHNFTVTWLKRRIVRFLRGIDGVDFGITQTYDVSIRFAADNTLLITLDDSFDFQACVNLQQGIASGVLQLPFQFKYLIYIGTRPMSGFGYFAFGVSSF